MVDKFLFKSKDLISLFFLKYDLNNINLLVLMAGSIFGSLLFKVSIMDFISKFEYTLGSIKYPFSCRASLFIF